MLFRSWRASSRGFSGLLITLAIHGGLLAAIAAANSQEQPPLVINRDFVMAEMVKLGKPREKFWLPRLVQPPPPKAPDALKISDDPNAQPKPKEAPRADDPNISKDMKRALERAKRLEALAAADEPDEGLATGSKLGTSNQAIGDQYLAQVKGLLLQNYALPAGIAATEIQKPPRIRITIGADGRLSGIKLLDSSGNSFVDDACVNAAQLTRQVPAPPAQYSNRGIGVECEK